MIFPDAVLHVNVDGDDVGVEDVQEWNEGNEDGGLANPAAGVDSAAGIAPVAFKRACGELRGIVEPLVQKLPMSGAMVGVTPETKGLPEWLTGKESAISLHLFFRALHSGGCEGNALRGEGVSGDINQVLGWEDDRREREVLSMGGEGPDAKANDSADESRLQNSRKEERKKRKERLSLEVRKEARSKRDTFLSIL